MEYRTASALAAALRAREMSASELLEQTIRDIEARDGAINAMVVRDFERARGQARAADRALAGGDHRPLLGLPMSVKEAFNVAGLPTTWGVPETKAIPVTQDAVVVARLKAAGAIIIGKTNVPVMLADWQSANPVYGVTNNPWDLTRTPGGSSGGGAAALAAGFVSLEYGSDLASSLRAPAHFCGVYAHKPSYGLTPSRGFVPPGVPVLSAAPAIDLSVVGPMARGAADLALALGVTAGPDTREALAYRLHLPPPRHARLRDHRVLVIDHHPRLPTAASITEALAALAERLEDAGCEVGRAEPLTPDLAEITSTYVELMMAIFAADMPRGDYTHRDWILADRRRVALADQWASLFQRWDVVLCPAMPTTAFPHQHGGTEGWRLEVDGSALPYESQPLWGSLASLTGNPATAMPIGRDLLGLPIGVQVIGAYLEDLTTIGFAGLVEREFGGFVPPPGYG